MSGSEREDQPMSDVPAQGWPVAWQCIDERHEFRYIKGIVTVNKETVEAWKDGGIAFVGLGRIVAPAEQPPVREEACGSEGCDFFDMLWAWFADEGRAGRAEMRQRARDGLSADDFKEMLDEHEGELLGSRSPAGVPTSALAPLILEYARDLRRNSSGGDFSAQELETMKSVSEYLETLVIKAAGSRSPAANDTLRSLIGRLSDYFRVNAKRTDSLAQGYIRELDALIATWPSQPVNAAPSEFDLAVMKERDELRGQVEKMDVDLAFCREAMRHSDIDLSMMISEIANRDMQKSIRKTLDRIDEARRRCLSLPSTNRDEGLPTHEEVRGILKPTSTNCQHDWKIWPETDGQEQRCMKCGEYRRTPTTENNRG
jgi:hypothetical protein